MYEVHDVTNIMAKNMESVLPIEVTISLSLRYMTIELVTVVQKQFATERHVSTSTTRYSFEWNMKCI